MSRKRRGRGEGSISQRGDGSWEARLSLGYDGDGHRNRRTVYGKTRRKSKRSFARFSLTACWANWLILLI